MSARSMARNGLYAVAEYALPQLGLLLAAPFLLARLGAAQLGIWMLASAAVSSGALVSAGFGDAAVKFVAMYRGRRDHNGIERVLRGMLLVNASVGGLLSVALWCAAPRLASHMARMDAVLQHLCIVSLRIGAALLLLRSLEGVFVSVQRGMEHYGPASRIALVVRMGTLVCAVSLAAMGYGVVVIVSSTLVLVASGVLAQARQVRIALPGISLAPSIDRPTLRLLAGYGCFTWLQVAAAILFSQADRIAVGVLLGPDAVAYYGLCTQATQPIHGLVAAGFHALFPRLSARAELATPASLRETLARALRTNVLLAAALSIPLSLGSYWLLRFWLRPSIAGALWIPLSLLAVSYGLLALNVTAHFALLAFGEVRRVTWFNLGAAVASLSLMCILMPRYGLTGAASARLVYGPVTLLLYIPLFARLARDTSTPVVCLPLREVA